MIIGIVGVGYVGRALGYGFAQYGHDLLLNDIRNLRAVWAEEFIASKERLMAECDVIFICVDTPAREDGNCDLRKVYDAFNELHKAWAMNPEPEKKQPIIVIKSTVIPGTADTLQAAYPWVASNPEFLRQAHANDDFLNPDRIVIGASKPEVAKFMEELYKDFDCPIINCSHKEAELIKYLSNSFFITKVAFAQEISRISTMLVIDAMKVYEGITADKRIDHHHLDPSLGRISLFTPCLAKDMMALIKQLDESGYETHFMKTAYAKAVDGVRLDFKLEVEK